MKKFKDQETGEQISQHEYLYGKRNVMKVPDNIIKSKVKALKVELKKQNDIHYMKRDTPRVNAILKAISFWEKINER